MNKSIQERKTRSPYKKSHYFFQKRSDMTLEPTPGTKKLITYLDKKNFVPNNVLDLGCGNGRNSYFLAQKYGSETTLVDKQKNFLDKASQHLSESGFFIKRRLLASIESLNSQNLGTFDVVLCSYVLQNIHPNQYFNVLSLLHSVTSNFLVVEIYQNPNLYGIGKFTLRGSTGWYGFTKKEIGCLLHSNFDIIWQDGSVSDKGGPSTINFILSPRSNFQKYSFSIFKRNIPVVNLEGTQIVSNERSIVFEENEDINSASHEFHGLYPPCNSCQSEICRQYECRRLKHWMGSIRIQNYPDEKNWQQFKQDYPICVVCNNYSCLGYQCPNLLSWIDEIKSNSPDNSQNPKP